MFIKPTSNAKDGNIQSVHPEAWELLLYPVDDSTPTPWDADIDIASGRVVIEGRMAPGGGILSATCKCEFDIKDFGRFYHLEIPNHVEDYDGLVKAILDAGWEETKGFK